MFQGIKSLREQNWQPLNLDIAETDIVILTHAHLDHCAILPPPDFFTKADYIVMESTYGDRLHDPPNLSAKLEYWINQTVKNRGNIILDVPIYYPVRVKDKNLILIYETKAHNL